MSKPKRIVIGIAGASGVTYGIRLLECLQETDYETHLIISEAGKLNIEIETSYKADDVAGMADVVYDHKNVAAGPSSGSFLTEGMVVVPCTVKTLSGIANSYTENLLVRAADVSLKEKRKLVLVVRETPLHKGHLAPDVKGRRHGCPHFAAGPLLLPQAQNHSGHCRSNHRQDF